MVGTDRRRADGKPLLTRSPVYVLTVAVGVVVSGVGWIVAAVFERSIVATTSDVEELLAALPPWCAGAPATVATVGTVAAIVAIHVWLGAQRQFRRLFLADTASVVSAAMSALAGELLLSVQRPSVRELFGSVAEESARSSPTSPVVAGVVAALVLIRPWIPGRARPVVLATTVAWVTAHATIVDAPPYLGLVLDLGVALAAGSAVALALRTPNLQPDRAAIVNGLAEAGIPVAELHSASVDARGSEPWIGTMDDGGPIFVKALSTDQRAADLLFRAVRWIRLRRAGDAPPETSLRRAAEHEAFVAHHVHALGIATPRVLTVADVGPKKVAIAYEGVDGRSLDGVPAAEVTDGVLEELWQLVADLRRHRIAHRDLRLANVFVGNDGHLLLIDFGFAELSASDRLLDTDVAEVLAATAAMVGTRRAVRVAVAQMGVEAIERARSWLHPLAFSTATQRAIEAACGLESLRAEVDDVTGHTVSEYESLGRLSSARVSALALGAVGVYSLLLLIVDDDISSAVADIDVALGALAVCTSLLVIPLVAAGYRSAIGHRLGITDTIRAAAACDAPVAAITRWSLANRVLSDSARESGVRPIVAKRAASDWTMAHLAGAPLLVAGFAASGLRSSHSEATAIVLGLGVGTAMVLVQLALLRFGPSGRELVRVWIRPHVDRGDLLRAQLGTAGWSAADTVAHGVAFALASRAVGIETTFETLVAIGIFASTIASLTPAPGGIGAVESLSYLALLTIVPPGEAALGAVVTRLATFWIQLPVSLIAYRASRRFRARRALRTDEPRTDLAMADSTPSPSGPSAWWT